MTQQQVNPQAPAKTTQTTPTGASPSARFAADQAARAAEQAAAAEAAAVQARQDEETQLRARAKERDMQKSKATFGGLSSRAGYCSC